MEFEDLELGQHLWVEAHGKLLMVAKFDNDGYEVCGPWEAGISKDECRIIKLIDKPETYRGMELYY